MHYEHVEWLALYMACIDESILRRFLGGVDPSMRCRSSEGDWGEGSEIGDRGNEGTNDSGGSEDVVLPCVNDLIGTNSDVQLEK